MRRHLVTKFNATEIHKPVELDETTIAADDTANAICLVLVDPRQTNGRAYSYDQIVCSGAFAWWVEEIET